jgi:putative addiction module component (TIGR02574 family)
MTMRALEKEVLQLPPQSRVELAEKIIESLDDFASPEVAAEWDKEIERRVAEIRSGSEKGIAAEEVMRQAKRAVNEARRLSSTRRK